MREVIVSGRVVYTDDGRALVPASLDPESRADCAIILTGADLPPPACNASARGNLVDQRLAVSEWSLDPDPHPANVPLSGLPGADPAAVDQALATLPVEDSNMVSLGASKVIDGRPRRRSRWCTQQLSLLLGWLIKNRGRRTSTPSSETLTLPASGWRVRPERHDDGPPFRPRTLHRRWGVARTERMFLRPRSLVRL